MLTLALETVTRRGSVAFCAGSSCLGRVGENDRTHGERLPGEIVEWLAAHGFGLRDVDLFAVVCGPGSFTGLRVGIAAVQGLALAGQRRVVGVPTLDALATGWLATAQTEAVVLVPCLDGQRGEIFVSALDTTGATTADQCRGLFDPTVCTPRELPGLLGGRAEGSDVVLVGDGGRRYADVFAEILPSARIADAPMPLAEAAARMAAADPGLAVAPHALRPVYLRRPDAILARERRAAAGALGRLGEYSIRRACGTDDLHAVEALQRQTFSNPWGAEAIRWELEHTDVARLYVMHDSAGQLVAYCACWMVFDELHINSLAIDVRRRRQGLARRLLEHVLREAAAAGARAATLEVRSSNDAARGLYEGLGFRVEGVRRDYYQDPREDAVILWRRAL
jgi:tRNA threonylcarbamoyladenosine biosynthesis protein TsaB